MINSYTPSTCKFSDSQKLTLIKMNWCQGLLRKMQCAPLHPNTYYVFKQNKIYYSFTCRKEIQILIGVGFFSLVIYFMITILQVQGNVSFLIHK